MRIYTSTNDPLDFCVMCAPNEIDALADYGDMGDGPDGRGNCFAYDTAHPPYDSDEYTCHECGDVLTDAD
jgi:hypothetical protein